jgi:riboflavin kinase / FMN adenylyltransferase
MKVYTSLNEFSRVRNAVVTIGTFDGVHAGHRKIISRMKEIAAQNGGETVILTFFPHPRMVLYPDDQSLKLLNTLDEKIDLLKSFGTEHLIVHPFSKEFSELSYREFVEQVLVEKIGVQTLVIGYDHHFGKNREGSFDQLKALAPVLHFDIEEIPVQDVDHIVVSSSKIRKALFAGDIVTASSCLGYDYMIRGRVVKGKQLGRQLGFPTANIEINEKYKLVPADGVYAVMVEHDNILYKGMMNIGMNPTVGGTGRTIEVNILDFDQNIYGAYLRVYFKVRMRDELHLGSLEELKERMEMDRQAAIKLLS